MFLLIIGLWITINLKLLIVTQIIQVIKNSRLSSSNIGLLVGQVHFKPTWRSKWGSLVEVNRRLLVGLRIRHLVVQIYVILAKLTGARHSKTTQFRIDTFHISGGRAHR